MTLSFRYDARQASLVDLSADKDPAYYDLCAPHADVLIVPRGWERLDRRTPPPEPEPAASPDTPDPHDPRMDRYAALTAELPRLAAACGVTTAPQDAATAGRRATRRMERAVVPERDGVPPVARASSAVPGGPPYEPVTRSLLPDEVFELDGQLQMPIEPEQRGVVVALTRTRNA